jgi:hypothetical protein
LISVRSEVQVFPGPPLQLTCVSRLLAAFVFWYGAIAQLGERVLCKHEVVGSIPSGSTRWFVSSADVRRHLSAKTNSFACFTPDGAACVISDIVKRRSIRVGSCKAICASHHNLQIVFGAWFIAR